MIVAIQSLKYLFYPLSQPQPLPHPPLYTPLFPGPPQPLSCFHEMTKMPQKGQLKICNYYYIDSGKFFPEEFWIDRANIFESSSTPLLISLVQIQLTGTEATLGDPGAWTGRHLHGAISFTPGDEKSRLSAPALKDRKIGDRATGRKDTFHSFPGRRSR